MAKGKLTRDISKKECPWLDHDLKSGQVVYKFNGYTYGCIGPKGVAVSDKEDDGPFYEVPSDSVDWG